MSMICKYCGKRINCPQFACSKCRDKYKKAKQNSIPNGIDYIKNILYQIDKEDDDNHGCSEKRIC